MKKTEKTYHLANLINLKPNMKIAIDDAVSVDADGSFLINVGYLRVSTDRQADLGFGLEIQESDPLLMTSTVLERYIRAIRAVERRVRLC